MQNQSPSPLKNQNFRRNNNTNDEMTAREKARNKSTVPNRRQNLKSSMPNTSTIDDSALANPTGSLMENSATQPHNYYNPTDANMNGSNQTLPHLNHK